jgi:hypothetical protein
MLTLNSLGLNARISAMSRKPAMWLTITLILTAGAFAAGQTQTTVSLPDGEGRQILETSCMSCHTLDGLPKFKGQYTRKDWQDVVDTMIAYGAVVQNKDVPVLIDYLTKNFGKE